MNVYTELAKELSKKTYISPIDSEAVVQALEDIGVLDYDTLKEIYLPTEEEAA